MLDARNITVTLGRREILHSVDFAAQAGELTVIIGPNGSGKTTLMRALTGEIDFDGTITLNGRDIRRQLPWKLAAVRGVLPQSTPLSFPFTVLEIVRLGLHASPDAERNRLPVTALDAVGLSGFEGRFYQELSGGEQQRVQLARVLCQVWSPVCEDGPRWLFLDEPVSSLDIGHQLMIMRLAKDYARRGGGVVAVMHDLNMTALHADRLALISEGHIIAHGSPDAVLTDHNLQSAYHCVLRVNTTPQNGLYVLPHSAA
ncbi:heme ABC transporter ATP-binding protein [Qingshengfaniella alkalisoli]|uniref:Heme ABC transporter ATP-binding protein n=1 Tax=Qingshengfaniella alkalisoli TaxID=2599296 RepID=A0A5B8J1X8_9RHOB|nr:heme ABC transporter ATP-binding protein [Qingshengfaniella alkalisoli]QDY68230.1 heme ABC transporter ATP-binding protein [Qingshengfaniella alkalisoli]